MNEPTKLSEKSREILEMIAAGKSYAQIVDGNFGIAYLDIFGAASEAVQAIDGLESPADYHARLASIKAAHPRAYEKWDSAEDAELKQLHSEGTSARELAQHFGRQPSAIRSRLNKLGLQD